jgi:hypothetical protein
MLITQDEIREVFLRNGFTIKEGQTDLKPYVYAAAVDLIRLTDKKIAESQQKIWDEFTQREKAFANRGSN